eukprot:TRINITY_DN71302_c0_g1_i1.p2 TRINITY_DN71302_c0_g1~~TRINITY_DN71302_c0_g1_i1.p2  ORF type:complete len:247 (+),score=9.45 TRINITY_DN71302_c0_g1_i1:241-981(+)
MAPTTAPTNPKHPRIIPTTQPAPQTVLVHLSLPVAGQVHPVSQHPALIRCAQQMCSLFLQQVSPPQQTSSASQQTDPQHFWFFLQHFSEQHTSSSLQQKAPLQQYFPSRQQYSPQHSELGGQHSPLQHVEFAPLQQYGEDPWQHLSQHLPSQQVSSLSQHFRPLQHLCVDPQQSRAEQHLCPFRQHLSNSPQHFSVVMLQLPSPQGIGGRSVVPHHPFAQRPAAGPTHSNNTSVCILSNIATGPTN